VTQPAQATPDAALGPPEPSPSPPATTEPPQPTTSPPPERPSIAPGKKEEDPDVDRVALAQELSKLLQENEGGDENH